MKSRIRTRKKSPREQTPDFSTTPAQPMFQSRSFVVQSQSTEKSQQQPDLKTKLIQAERYGHHLRHINPAGVPAATAVQQKMAMGKPEQSDRAEAKEVISSQQVVSTPEYKKERKVDKLAVQQGGREVGSAESASGRELAKSQYVVQRAVTTKGEGGAKRTEGSLEQLEKEVLDTIAKAKQKASVIDKVHPESYLEDINQTIRDLNTSIINREKSPKTKAGKDQEAKHTHRINQEKDLLKQLQGGKKEAQEAKKKAQEAKEPALASSGSGNGLGSSRGRGPTGSAWGK